MTTKRVVTSRLPGFYREPIARRLDALRETGLLSGASLEHLAEGGGLATATADRMSENVVATHGLPLSLALNFTINGRDHLVPMSIEEPSVVAAASNAARMVRPLGGFSGHATESIMTAQVQLDGVPEPEAAAERLEAARGEILRASNAAIPRMVARGGGARECALRVLDRGSGMVVVHIDVDVGDAMGANVADAVAEAAAPHVQDAVGGRVGLRILTNLAVRRMVEVSARARIDDLGGEEVAHGIESAGRFAELDPYRAATHNKGIMNGVDAVAVALGQDWRALEAGAHSFAALEGRYRPLSTWKACHGVLAGTLRMPLPCGTVGGAIGAHPCVRAALEVVGVGGARELAVLIGAVGLATNLAALRALVAEGIQEGHMRLHARKSALDSQTCRGEPV